MRSRSLPCSASRVWRCACAMLHLQKNWHKGEVANSSRRVGGMHAEPPAFPLWPPRVEGVAALHFCPKGSSKGGRERHPQMCASNFWKSLKLSSREQLH